MTSQVKQRGEARGGGMTEEVSDWQPDRQITRAAMEDLEAMFSAWPACGLCGQRAGQLDKYGLCSKVSQAHKDWRAGVRAERAGAR